MTQEDLKTQLQSLYTVVKKVGDLETVANHVTQNTVYKQLQPGSRCIALNVCIGGLQRGLLAKFGLF